jgi:hypothetical protein
MKKGLLAALLCLVLTVNAQNKSLKDLTGSWVAVNENDAGIEVVDSVTIYVVYGTQRKVASGPAFDFSKSPIRFNFTINDEKQNLSMHSLILFVNEDLLQWQIFDGDVQPVAFSSNQGDLMYLRRKK